MNVNKSNKWIIGRIAAVLTTVVIGWLLGVRPIFSDPGSGQDSSIYLPLAAGGDGYANCRIGAGVVNNPVISYPYNSLNLGWYVDWRVSDIPPNGLSYYRTVRVKQGKVNGVYTDVYTITPTLDFSPNGLGPVILANPGQVWLVGNEPDRPYSQDDVMPDMYAQIYHEVYAFIKGIDPTAQVAIGAVVQPTPLRLQYLDKVLATYQTKYGARMPIDVMNVHTYMIDELRYGGGASIPPGFTDVQTGTLFTLQQHLDVNVFAALLTNMRYWMKARGYGRLPLIVTEYGALYPLWYLDDAGLTQADIDNYLRNVNQWIETTKDPDLGDPFDNYRLVQQAALYSLDDDSAFPLTNTTEIPYHWGSFLFNSEPPYTRTATGQAFTSMATSMPVTVDLQPVQIGLSNNIIVSPATSLTTTMQAFIANAGNIAPSSAISVEFTEVTNGQTQLLGSVVIPPFTGCGTSRTASILLPNLAGGPHLVRVQVDPQNTIQEIDKLNNIMTTTVLVATSATYLPLLSR